MHIKIKKSLALFFTVSLLAILTVSPVFAQSYTILPKAIADIISGNPVLTLFALIRTGLYLVFAGTIAMTGYYIYQASRSYLEDEEGDLAAGSKKFKAIFVSLSSLFLGMLVFAVFLGFFDVRFMFPPAICVDSPNSYGCFACQNSEPGDKYSTICDKCSDKFTATIGGMNVSCNAVKAQGELVTEADFNAYNDTIL